MDEKNKNQTTPDTTTPNTAATAEQKNPAPTKETGASEKSGAETPNANAANAAPTHDTPNPTPVTSTTASEVSNMDEDRESRRPLFAFIAGVVTALVIWQVYSVITTHNEAANPSFPNPVATVNGTPVDQQLFEQNVGQSLNQAAAQGLDVSEPAIRDRIAADALEVIINTRLLVTAAEAAEYRVTDEEIAARITELETQFGSAEALDAELANLGLDRDGLQSDVREQLIVDAFLTEEVIGENAAATEADIQQVYEGLIEAGQDLPSLDGVRDAIAAQVEQQKQASLIEAFIIEERAAAEIEINL